MESMDELKTALSREKMKNVILEKENMILQDTVFRLSEENKKYDNIRNNIFYRIIRKLKRIFKR